VNIGLEKTNTWLNEDEILKKAPFFTPDQVKVASL
jgi:hypothetical protein